MTIDPHITTAIASIRAALARYTFRVRSEAELQAQVVAALAAQLPKSRIETEVRRGSGRFDIVLKFGWHDNDDHPMRYRRYYNVVLELKVKSSAAAVERQAQRYALLDDVDAVLVVTTSSRLALEIEAQRCRRCSECPGQDHHWLEYCPEDCDEDDPEYECKHCLATCRGIDDYDGFMMPDGHVSGGTQLLGGKPFGAIAVRTS